MPVSTPNGYLDFTNATPRATKVIATSNVGIGTSNPEYGLDLHGTANVGALTAISVDIAGGLSLDLPVATIASNLVTYDTTTGELFDSGGLISNKLAIVSEQPPIALTGATTTVSGHGKYVVTSSSVVGSNYDYNIFSKNETDAWISLTDTFNVDGTYAGSESLGGVSGEWVKLEMPYKTTLRHFTLRHDIDNTVLGQRRQFPIDFKIVASNDDTNWQTLNTTTGVSTPEASDPALTFVVNASASYKFYAIVVEKITSGANFNRCHIGEWKLYTETFTVDAGKVNMTGASGLETGFTEHPVAPMTGYHTYVEGHGTYEASASSSNSTYYPWQAFDHVAGSETRWSIASPQNRYNTTTGEWDQTAISAYPNIYTSDVGGTRYAGHWLQIKLPYAITLSHSNVHPTNGYGLDRGPKDGVILGSNDGEYWHKLTEFSGKTYSDNTWTRIDVNARTPYQYYRMCITKVVGGTYGSYTELTEWRLFAEKDVTKFENVHISGDLSSETLQTGYIKWPRKSLKANESEGYVASASSAVNFDVFTLYNERLVGFNTEYWSTNVTYTNGVHDNTVSTTDINGVVHYGEWAQIQLPTEVALSFLKVYPRRYGTDVWPLQRVPSAGSILGSNDGTTWKNIQRFSGVTYTLESTVSGEKIDVHASETYKYYRLVCTTLLGVTSAADRVDMMELQLFEAATGVGGAPTSAKLQVHGSLGLAKGSSLYAGDSVVAEFPKHDRPLTKYPEVAMTAASTAGYVANASSFYNFSSYPAHEIFNGVYGTELDMWVSSLYTYNVADGTVDTSNVATFQGISGEYVTLNLPKKISLKKVRLHSRNNSGASNPPNKGRIFGSNGDSIWKQLTTYDDLNMSHNDYRTIQVNATEYYKNYTFLIEEITIFGTATYACIAELELYGHEEGDESVDVVHRSVPNKPGQQQLAVYWDANDSNSYSFADSSNVYDLSGSGVTGTITGTNGFDAEYNAWVFDGTSDIRSTVNTFSGDQPHTMSVWVYISNALTTADGYISILAPNTGETIDEVSSIRFQNDGFNMQSWGNDIRMYNLGIQKERWYHLTAVYDGGGVTTASKRLYINSVQEIRISTDATSGNTINFTNTTLSLGSRVDGTGSHLKGSIANFRLFSKALNPDQVRELYEYDAPRFGHRTNVVALHKGNLGIGVNYPNSRFEVAGREDLQEYPPKAMTGYETYMEGHGVFRASQSSPYPSANYTAWKVFDKDLTYGAHFLDSYSSTNDYIYDGAGTRSDGLGGFSGEWVMLEMPYAINLKSFAIAIASLPRAPEDFVILASNDSTAWTQLINYTGLGSSDWPYVGGASGYVLKHFTVPITKEYYRYFAIVVTRTESNDYLQIDAMEYYGTPAPSGLEDGHLTLGKALTAPRFTGHAAGAETPRAESLVVHYDTTVDSVVSGTTVVDISGQGNNGTLVGATYSSSDRALHGRGIAAGDYTTTPITLTGGAMPLTISMWFRAETMVSSPNVSVLSLMGNKAIGQGFIVSYRNNGIWQDLYGKGVFWSTTLTTNQWYHLTTTYNGGNIESGSSKMYLDGVELTSYSVSGTGGVSLPGSTNLELFDYINGSNDRHQGDISNFKLWGGVALTAEEVAAEYALGRTGKSLNVTDTAVCIGGTVPRAQLDVRGSLHAPGVILNTIQYIDSTNRSTTSNAPVAGYETPWTSMKANSKVNLDVHIPYRNDGTGWGGSYHLIYMMVNQPVGTVPANTWVLLSNSGYHMTYYQDIMSYTNSYYIPLSVSSDFSIRFRHDFRVYNSGTLYINQSHDINRYLDNNLLQFGVSQSSAGWTKFIVQEIGG